MYAKKLFSCWFVGTNNANNSNSSNYVRRELREMVVARQQSGPSLPQLPVPSGQSVDLESLGLSFEMPGSGTSVQFH